MPVPPFADMVKKDLADLQRLKDRVLPVKVGRAVQESVRENFRRGTPYSNTHNEGEEIGVTPKMRKYFWARHLEDKKRYGVEAPETEFWKRMALKKPGSRIKIPRRHFLGPDKHVDRMVQEIIENELENFIKTHNHGTTVTRSH